MKDVKVKILRAIGSIGMIRVNGLPMALVILFAAELLIVPVIYIAGWFAMWYATKRPDLPGLLALIRENHSGPTIAAITAVAVLLVNKNGNGIPDSLEKQFNEDEKKGSGEIHGNGN